MTYARALCLVCGFFISGLVASGQDRVSRSDCEQPATIILFRTFNFISVGFSYNLFEGDSLLGRMKTKEVLVYETYDNGISIHAKTKAPSLNADKRTNYQKIKTIKYPFTLKPGQVYFVKCGFLNENIFDYPRQPTIRLLKNNEIRKYLKRPFLRKSINSYLYEEWLTEKDLKKYRRKKRGKPNGGEPPSDT